VTLNDPDSIINTISSKYYDLEELKDTMSDIPPNSAFSVFHCNTRSLPKQFSSLQDLLVSIENQFNVIQALVKPYSIRIQPLT
jgi:hypothetical protein